MGKQMVVRTYPKGWTNQMASLQNLLSKGYKVAHVTPLPEGITEYIIEKEKADKTNCHLDIDVKELVRERDDILNERNSYKLLYEEYREEQDKDNWGR